uniref:WW domain-containing protein n=1 Tax=Macrostomum lignano TaxID=282301 RepID=A0A1I8J2H6_9PLAT
MFPSGAAPGAYSAPAPQHQQQPHHAFHAMPHHQMGHPAAAAAATDKKWAEHTMPDGKTYYYNLVTGKTVWEKPDDLKTEWELIMARCPWREFRTDAGKVYYSHSVTNQSVWTKPEELRLAEQQAEMARQRAAAAAAIEPLRQMQHLQQSGPPPPPTAAVGSPAASGGGGGGGSSAIEEAMKKTLESFGVIPPTTDAAASDAGSSASAAGKRGGGKRRRGGGDMSGADDDSDSSEDSDGSGGSGRKKKKNKPQQQEQSKEDVFKELLRDRRVPSSATWETAVRMIQEDPRYQQVKHLQHRRQVFNNYKTQRQKEEKEEQRLKIKKAREDLEQFLLQTAPITSSTNREDVRRSARLDGRPERDRRDIFDDAVREIDKREREAQRALQRRNIERFDSGGMKEMNYLTTWTEAQQMLSNSASFRSDRELLDMDKEDALICFQKHVTRLEKEEDDKKEENQLRQRRQRGRIERPSLCCWTSCMTRAGSLRTPYGKTASATSAATMLCQQGSTPLDLFKFYVDDLKKRFPEEKRIVKEIMKDRAFSICPDTALEDFLRLIASDERGRSLDPGNVERSFDSLQEKARCIEQEKRAEERRKMQRHAEAFKELLFSADPPVDASTSWDTVRERFGQADCFQAIPLESERLIVFKDFLKSLAEPAASAAPRPEVDKDKDHRSKDKDRKKSRRNSDGDLDGEKADSGGERDKKAKKKKKKQSRHSDDGEGEAGGEKKKKKKDKKEKEQKKHRKEGKSSSGGGSSRKRKRDEGGGGGDDLPDDGEESGGSRRRQHRSRRHSGASSSAAVGKRARRHSSRSSAASGDERGGRGGGSSKTAADDAPPKESQAALNASDSMDLSEGELEKERERLIAQLHD